MQVTNSTAAQTQTGASTSSAAAAGAHSATLDYNSFLKLLLAQMKNQDPTSPADSTQWVAQLATFSNVEQAIQANAKLDQILTNSRLGDAASLVGRTVASADGQTSGVIASVTMSNDGMTAVLDSGATISLDQNVSVR